MSKKKEHPLQIIAWVVAILVGVITISIFIAPRIHLPQNAPFELTISPTEIPQGIYDYENEYNLNLKIDSNSKLNLSNIQILEKNVRVYIKDSEEEIHLNWESKNYNGYVYSSSNSLTFKKVDKEISIFGPKNYFFSEGKIIVFEVIIEYSLDGLKQPLYKAEKEVEIIS